MGQPARAVACTKPAKHKKKHKKKLKPLPSISLGRWQHVESRRHYRIMDVVRIEKDLSPGVAYKRVTGGDTWIRPFDEFLGKFQFLGKD